MMIGQLKNKVYPDYSPDKISSPGALSFDLIKFAAPVLEKILNKLKRYRRFPQLTALVNKVNQKVKADMALLVGDCAQASPDIHAKRIFRIKGCPSTHKRIDRDMMVKLFLLASLVRPSLIRDGFGLYPLKKIKGMLVNLKFKPQRSV